jgi:hypothetical protein
VQPCAQTAPRPGAAVRRGAPAAERDGSEAAAALPFPPQRWLGGEALLRLRSLARAYGLRGPARPFHAALRGRNAAVADAGRHDDFVIRRRECSAALKIAVENATPGLSPELN